MYCVRVTVYYLHPSLLSECLDMHMGIKVLSHKAVCHCGKPLQQNRIYET